AEPHHREDRCLRAEPLPPVMQTVLDRLGPVLERDHADGTPPNTCLINYYGSVPKRDGAPPVDYARLRMHRDAEPGAVAMLSVGQPAQFEFVAPGAEAPAHAQWVRHRSVVIISGPDYKDRLYHRVTRVRHGRQPALSAILDDFEVRRVSVSFRHVPDTHIHDLGELDPDARAVALPYVQELAPYAEHFRRQLDTLPLAP
ncbi:MAG: alpha-ketoglutarate-dependent dioxygenase AlkB, partial [Myxococcota bacterium]|nr:alpha-ketoglutarate-dependent dioxygenase AlkB [Myxococcota bacterium]